MGVYFYVILGVAFFFLIPILAFFVIRVLITSENKIQQEINANSYSKPVETLNIKNVDFNVDTKRLTITFLKQTKYKTIEKYVQRNYQKNPIYSD